MAFKASFERRVLPGCRIGFALRRLLAGEAGSHVAHTQASDVQFNLRKPHCRATAKREEQDDQAGERGPHLRRAEYLAGGAVEKSGVSGFVHGKSLAASPEY